MNGETSIKAPATHVPVTEPAAEEPDHSDRQDAHHGRGCARRGVAGAEQEIRKCGQMELKRSVRERVVLIAATLLVLPGEVDVSSLVVAHHPGTQVVETGDDRQDDKGGEDEGSGVEPDPQSEQAVEEPITVLQSAVRALHSNSPGGWDAASTLPQVLRIGGRHVR